MNMPESPSATAAIGCCAPSGTGSGIQIATAPGTTDRQTAAEPCCGTADAAAAAGSCCAPAAKATAVTAGAGCCD
jgi:hypothetical protein